MEFKNVYFDSVVRQFPVAPIS